MGIDNNLFLIARADLKIADFAMESVNDEMMQNMAAYHTQQAIENVIKQLIINARGYGNIDHDIQSLIIDARELGIIIPEWIEDHSYEISKWATTVRYNSNFKANHDSIKEYIQRTKDWLKEIE